MELLNKRDDPIDILIQRNYNLRIQRFPVIINIVLRT